jgi:hypothetical protein
MCGHFLYVNGDHSMLQSNIDRPIRHEKIDVFLRIPLTIAIMYPAVEFAKTFQVFSACKIVFTYD